MQDCWEIQQDSLIEDVKEAMSDTSRKLTGEEKLQFAALEDVGGDINRLWSKWRQNGLLSKRDQRLWKESIEWIFSSEEEYLLSFLGICSSLKLRPQRMRENIQQLRDEVEGVA